MPKTLLRSVLPLPVLHYLRRWKRATSERRALQRWDAARDYLAAGPTAQPRADPPRSLMIFPSDPNGIVGAVGDDAMITATVAHFTALYPGLTVSMLCNPGRSEQIVRDRGLRAVPIPTAEHFAAGMAAILADNGHDALAVLGADVMDGHYSVDHSIRAIIAADLAARAGLRALILGFSFNAKPHPALAAAFARLDRRVVLNLRDAVSLKRFRAFAPVPARLVADAAFTLEPGQVDGETTAWITSQRAAGRRVIGINLHPMLVRPSDPARLNRMIAQMADAITAASAVAPLAWLLIPHDYRDDSGDGDGLALEPLQTRLARSPDIHHCLFPGRHPAATLKALAGQVDGVVTGRMHLAVAALGMGVPVMCLTYQGKFEGLLAHFDLPADHLLTPEMLEREGALTAALDGFLRDLPDLSAQVQRKLPEVLALANVNFAPMPKGAP